MTKRNEISDKISELEGVDATDNDATVKTDDSLDVEMELESLKKEYDKYQLLAEKVVFTNKAIVKK